MSAINTQPQPATAKKPLWKEFLEWGKNTSNCRPLNHHPTGTVCVCCGAPFFQDGYLSGYGKYTNYNVENYMKDSPYIRVLGGKVPENLKEKVFSEDFRANNVINEVTLEDSDYPVTILWVDQ